MWAHRSPLENEIWLLRPERSWEIIWTSLFLPQMENEERASTLPSPFTNGKIQNTLFATDFCLFTFLCKPATFPVSHTHTHIHSTHTHTLAAPVIDQKILESPSLSFISTSSSARIILPLQCVLNLPKLCNPLSFTTSRE